MKAFESQTYDWYFFLLHASVSCSVSCASAPQVLSGIIPILPLRGKQDRRPTFILLSLYKVSYSDMFCYWQLGFLLSLQEVYYFYACSVHSISISLRKKIIFSWVSYWFIIGSEITRPGEEIRTEPEEGESEKRSISTSRDRELCVFHTSNSMSEFLQTVKEISKERMHSCITRVFVFNRSLTLLKCYVFSVWIRSNHIILSLWLVLCFGNLWIRSLVI